MKQFLFAGLVACIGLASCTKTTNNNISNTYPVQMPAFTVDGLTDVRVPYGNYPGGQLPVTVTYRDSTQQYVSVSLSGIPAGFRISPINGVVAEGVPTFSFVLSFDDYNNGVPIGTYPVTLTAIGSVSGTKTFSFNVIVY